MRKSNVLGNPAYKFPAGNVMDNIVDPLGFRWMPAAALPTPLLRFNILTRYKKFDFQPFNKKVIKSYGKTKWDLRLSLPTKDIRIIPNSMEFDPEAYDEVIYADPFDPRSKVGDYLDWALGSAHYCVGQYPFNWGQPSDIKLVFDSGGAQLKVGTADYVNPYEIIDVMNHGANAGFALDVPPRLNVDVKNQTANDVLALLQKKNNDIFLGNRREDLALLNILHGTTVDEFNRWLDVVQDDGFQGWALGIDDSNDFLAGVRGALVLHEHFGESSENPWWLHIFGASGPKIIPAMAWFGRVHPHLTSDSSSWYEGARRGTYYNLNEFGLMFNQRLSYALKDRSISDSITGVNKQNTDFCWSPAGLLPCQCEMCSTIEYVDAMIDNPWEAGMMSLHDMMTMKRFGHQWNTMAQTMSFDDYFAATRLLMGQKAADMVEYIHIGIESGLKEAEKRFMGGPSSGRKTSGLISNSSDGKKMSLFGQRDMSKFQTREVVEEEPEKTEEDLADAEEILHLAEDQATLPQELLESMQEDDEKEQVQEKDVIVRTDTSEIPKDVPKSFAEYNVRHPKARGIPGVIFEDPASEFYGYAPDVVVGPIEGQPEPTQGWPTTKYVAKAGSVWIHAETTKYGLKWKKEDQCVKVIHPPQLEKYDEIKASLPSECPMGFPDMSNVECLMNYIDPNSEEDMKAMADIHPELPTFIYFKLVHDPDYWRMMEIHDNKVFIPEKDALPEEVLMKNKRYRLHKCYADLRQAMETGDFDHKLAFVGDPDFARKGEPKVRD